MCKRDIKAWRKHGVKLILSFPFHYFIPTVLQLFHPWHHIIIFHLLSFFLLLHTSFKINTIIIIIVGVEITRLAERQSTSWTKFFTPVRARHLSSSPLPDQRWGPNSPLWNGHWVSKLQMHQLITHTQLSLRSSYMGLPLHSSLWLHGILWN
jgi:hypothetical protein